MGFDLSNLYSYISGNAVGKTVSGNSSDQRENNLTLKDLTAFQKGSSITGQVISVEGDIVQLKLSDDTYVNAKLEQDLNVAVGQKLTFEVKSNSGNTLSLIPLFTNLNASTNVIKGLEAANLPVNETSVNMVKAMMDKGMSIDVNSLQSMYRQVLSNPRTLPSTLVEMKGLSIPITKENIVQFEAYQNYEHQIVSAIEELADTMEQTCLDFIQAGDSGSAVAIYKEVISMLEEGFAVTEGVVESLGMEGAESTMEAEGTGNPEKLDVRILQLENYEESPEGASFLKEESPIDSMGNTAAALRENAAVKIVQEEILQLSMEQGVKESGAADFHMAFKEINISEKQLTFLTDSRESSSLIQQLEQMGISKEIVTAVKDGSISMKQLLSLIRQMGENNPDSTQLQKLYTSKEFHHMIKSQLTKQLLLTPEAVGKEGKVNEYYNKLNEHVTRLTDVLSGLGKEDTSLFKSVNQLRQNVDFMNQLNQTFTYVQLPLKFSEKSAHGDLYVYTNKKNLAKEEGSISALLHLDMEHLGPVDVYVVMTGGEQVNTRFYLKDDEMLDLIERNIHILNARLEKRGYQMKAEFSIKEQETKGFGELLTKREGGEKNRLLFTQAFDVRA